MRYDLVAREDKKIRLAIILDFSDYNIVRVPMSCKIKLLNQEAWYDQLLGLL